MPIESQRNFDPKYIEPPDNIGSRWNWFQSELVTFPHGGSQMAHRHPNGGGWVSDTAFVSTSAYVAPFACVYDKATVLANAYLDNCTQVFGESIVFGGTYMSSGPSKVYSKGMAFGNPMFMSDRGEVFPGEQGAVFGKLIINKSGISSAIGTTFGSYSTSEKSDIGDPPKPQYHSSYNPITQSDDLKLTVDKHHYDDDDYSDICQKNSRDNFGSGCPCPGS